MITASIELVEHPKFLRLHGTLCCVMVLLSVMLWCYHCQCHCEEHKRNPQLQHSTANSKDTNTKVRGEKNSKTPTY